MSNNGEGEDSGMMMMVVLLGACAVSCSCSSGGLAYAYYEGWLNDILIQLGMDPYYKDATGTGTGQETIPPTVAPTPSPTPSGTPSSNTSGYKGADCRKKAQEDCKKKKGLEKNTCISKYKAKCVAGGGTWPSTLDQKPQIITNEPVYLFNTTCAFNAGAPGYSLLSSKKDFGAMYRNSTGCDKSTGTQYILEKSGDSYLLKLAGVVNGYLQVTGASPQDGFILYKNKKASATKFQLIRKDNEGFYLRSPKDKNKFLSISGCESTSTVSFKDSGGTIFRFKKPSESFNGIASCG